MKPLDKRESPKAKEEPTNVKVQLAQEDVIANYHKTMEALEV